jgi:hypothetical protein
MASGYSPKLKFELIGSGEQAGLWGTTTNKNIGELIEQAIAGVTTVDLTGISGDYTLSSLDGTVDQARSAVISCSGAAAAAINIIIPTSTKLYVFRNACGKTITIKTAGQVGGVVLASGEANSVFCDGANALAGLVTAGSGTIPVSGGGTGNTSFTAGYLKSPGGTTQLTTAATIPAIDISGQVGVANGGTGASSLASGGLLIGNGTGTVASLTGGVNGYVPTWNGTTWVSAQPGGAGVTSISAGAGISVNQATGAVQITNTNTTNTVNPTFSSSVTTPTYYVGNTSNYIQLEGGGMGFVTSGTQANKFTSAGLGTNNIVAAGVLQLTGAGSAGDQRISITGAGYAGGIGPGAIQLGRSSFGVTYTDSSFDGQPGVAMITQSGSTLYLSNSSSLAIYAGCYTAYKGGSTTSWEIYSDSRIKKNVTPYAKGLTELNQIQIKNFEFNGLGNTIDGTKGLGVIADEIALVLPDTVKTIPTKLHPEDEERIDLKTFNNTELTYLLVNAVQELSAKVDAQAAEIAALKGAK